MNDESLLSELSYPQSAKRELRGKTKCRHSHKMPERIEVDRIDVQGPRIPSVPVVQTIPPTVDVPQPVVQTIEPPVIAIPGYVPPGYEPPRPNVGAPTPNVPASQSDELDVEGVAEYAGSLNLPANPFGGPREINRGTSIEVLGREIPVPTEKEVTLAGTTAMASVAAALVGKSIIEQLIKLMKPLVKKLIIKAKEKLGKDLTVQEAQLYFALESKGVMKVLKAEQKADLLEQRQLRQRRRRRKESSDGT
jgi:hypothetical protein